MSDELNYPVRVVQKADGTRAWEERDKPSELAPAPGSAKWSDEDLTWLLGEIETHSKLKEADNRKLLWLAMNTPAWKHLDMIGVVSAIFTELETRLYPEYDGETVTFEKWGWNTPEGEIRYLPNDQAQARAGLPATPQKL